MKWVAGIKCVRAGNVTLRSANAAFVEGGVGFIAFPAECREDSDLVAGARGGALAAGPSKIRLITVLTVAAR